MAATRTAPMVAVKAKRFIKSVRFVPLQFDHRLVPIPPGCKSAPNLCGLWTGRISRSGAADYRVDAVRNRLQNSPIGKPRLPSHLRRSASLGDTLAGLRWNPELRACFERPHRMALVKSLCVYCGSARGASPRYVAAAKELGEAMAERGIRL